MAAVPSIGRASAVQARPAAPEAELTRTLYERHNRQIFSYCLHQLGNREEAEDATQTTFMNAFRGLQRGVVPELESAWLFKIANNVILTRRRSSSRRRRVETPGDLDAIQDLLPSREADADELIRLTDALSGMPEQQRRALLLREWQGLSYREIGDELELSQAAVETLLFRARRSLAQGLTDPDAGKGRGKRLLRTGLRPEHAALRAAGVPQRRRRAQGGGDRGPRRELGRRRDRSRAPAPARSAGRRAGGDDCRRERGPSRPRRRPQRRREPSSPPTPSGSEAPAVSRRQAASTGSTHARLARAHRATSRRQTAPVVPTRTPPAVPAVAAPAAEAPQQASSAPTPPVQPAPSPAADEPRPTKPTRQQPHEAGGDDARAGGRAAGRAAGDPRATRQGPKAVPAPPAAGPPPGRRHERTRERQRVGQGRRARSARRRPFPRPAAPSAPAQPSPAPAPAPEETDPQPPPAPAAPEQVAPLPAAQPAADAGGPDGNGNGHGGDGHHRGDARR